MKGEKRILIIAYHFPPSSAVGGLRSSGYARYLPDYGWNPYVLTINKKYLQNPDAERLKGLEHVPIFRTRMFPSFPDNYVKLKAFLFSLVKREKILVEDLQREYAANEPNVESDYKKIGMRFKRFIFSLLVLPDGENGWIIPGLVGALRVIRKNRINVILTSGPPHSAHIIGLIAKRLTRVSWVADFRDPWAAQLHNRIYTISPLAIKLHHLLEKQVVDHADAVVTTTGMLADLFKDVYSLSSNKKIQFIPNGYDPEKIPADDETEKYTKFTIAYTGVLYMGRSPEPIFAALKQLMDEGHISPDKINLKLVGQCETIQGKSTSEVISQYGLEDVVELTGQVTHNEALKIIKKSHLALLLAPDQKLQVPAKVYDYIGCGAEILAIAEDSATSRLVKSAHAGMVFDADDIDGIKEFIYQSLKNKNLVRLKENKPETNFSRKNLTGTLSDILNGIAEGK